MPQYRLCEGTHSADSCLCVLAVEAPVVSHDAPAPASSAPY